MVFLYFLKLAGCKRDDECPLTQACIQRECQDPCPFEQCGIKASCSVSSHLARCRCPPGHKGSPYVECKPYECLTDPECPTTLACRNEKCVDPCDCAANADCEARNHRGICTCRPGYTGDPYFEGCRPSKKFLRVIENSFLNISSFYSVPEPVIEEQDCKVDVDCPALEICYTLGGRNRCVDPCSTISPCVANAFCKVYSTTPTRTMTCVCFEGYTGNGVVSCDKISKFVQKYIIQRD